MSSIISSIQTAYDTKGPSSESVKLALGAGVAIYVVVNVAQNYRESFWESLPAWVKPKKKTGVKADSNDSLANPSVILKKLQAMMELCREEVKHDLPWYKMHACLLAYLHLLRELRVVHPQFKNERYRNEGKNITDKAELSKLLKFCNLASWAYEDSFLELHDILRKEEYCLMRHDTATEPGRVGHFIAVNHVTKEVVISIKGTSTISDALTDALGRAVPHKLVDPLANPFATDGAPITDIRVHEGMYTAALMMCEDTQHLVENLLLPQKYEIVIVGHSLGAGVACLLGLFLHSRIAAATCDNVRVIAFATPTCLDLATARAISPFTTSVVNNNDCVPRLSVSNLVTLNKRFVRVNEKLAENGRSPDNWRSAKAYVEDLLKIDDELLMSPEELQQFEDEASDESTDNEHALFVPGRAIVMWKSDDNTMEVRVGDGGLKVLRRVEIETNMLSDHFCANYCGNLAMLVACNK